MSHDQNRDGIEYREVAGWPGYRVGTDGSFWSRRRAGSRGRMAEEWTRRDGSINPAGYVVVMLRQAGERNATARRLHVLVLEAFVGPRPPGHFACHINGDPADSRLVNLRWDTQVGNMADAMRHGTFPTGERNGKAKLNAEVAGQIRRMSEQGHSRASLAERFGIDASRVSKIVLGKLWNPSI